MRLSDLMAKSGNTKGNQKTTQPSASVPASPPPRKTDTNPPTRIYTDSTQKPAAQKPARMPLPPPAKQSSLYDSLPSAIYQAAEQLEIPIPQNRQLVLKNAREELSKVISLAIDPTYNHEQLWEKIRVIVADLSMLLAIDSNLARLLERDNDPAAQLSSHCINTALIAMDLAKEIKRVEFTAQEIGAAALLHDVGVAAMGRDFETDDIDSGLRDHVIKGVEILKDLKVPESVKTMVLQHHERMDGQGYPNGIAGKDFLISSQVLALAETFERIMADSFDEESGSSTPQKNYVQATLDTFHKALDPEILKTFISIRGFYPNGVMVELTNRSICLVIRQNEGFPLRPVIQVVLDSAGNHPDTARIIDLRSNNTLSIIKAITYNGDQG
ncbi:MAG: hypothetical protein A2283_08465 [Lentisphaerae bacterium RIFOXYA12_FULL_48_11]|nr:MAG: hypothetical protein A2283_08465 [Lentisphaerae bacterium RIFOXYA12_FULL_48_11]